MEGGRGRICEWNVRVRHKEKLKEKALRLNVNSRKTEGVGFRRDNAFNFKCVNNMMAGQLVGSM